MVGWVVGVCGVCFGWGWGSGGQCVGAVGGWGVCQGMYEGGHGHGGRQEAGGRQPHEGGGEGGRLHQADHVVGQPGPASPPGWKEGAGIGWPCRGEGADESCRPASANPGLSC